MDGLGDPFAPLVAAACRDDRVAVRAAAECLVPSTALVLLVDAAGWSIPRAAETIGTDATQAERAVALARLEMAGHAHACDTDLEDVARFAGGTLAHTRSCVRCQATREALRAGRRAVADMAPPTQRSRATTDVADEVAQEVGASAHVPRLPLAPPPRRPLAPPPRRPLPRPQRVAPEAVAVAPERTEAAPPRPTPRPVPARTTLPARRPRHATPAARGPRHQATPPPSSRRRRRSRRRARGPVAVVVAIAGMVALMPARPALAPAALASYRSIERPPEPPPIHDLPVLPKSTEGVDPAQAAAAPPPTDASAPKQVHAEDLAAWAELAMCEASARWDLDSGNGYYGGLQFLQASWELVGGEGRPHHAPAGEQIKRGMALLELQGWDAWPVCSDRLNLSDPAAD